MQGEGEAWYKREEEGKAKGVIPYEPTVSYGRKRLYSILFLLLFHLRERIVKQIFYNFKQ